MSSSDEPTQGEGRGGEGRGGVEEGEGREGAWECWRAGECVARAHSRAGHKGGRG